MHEKIYIIGSGILGLCAAEYFSRKNNNFRGNNNVTIISDNNPLAGSYAAAANLATKGQLFGRDPHFQMKLDAKKIYPSWINNLLRESQQKIPMDEIFKIGLGIDIFSNSDDRDKHLKRVQQEKEQLIAKNLPTDFILANKENEIIYQNEAWVHADQLLTLLKVVLKNRGITFIQNKFSMKLLEEIKGNNEKSVVIFCAGAWTKELLIDLELTLPQGFNKSERLTIGSTFYTQQNYNNDYVLFEKIAPFLKQKVTISGNSANLYISSSSIKTELDLKLDTENDELKKKNSDLINLAEASLVLKGNIEEKIGYRVGYGHSEILIESVNLCSNNVTAVVCCGAHKSGFLFAPIVGEKIFSKFEMLN